MNNYRIYFNNEVDIIINEMIVEKKSVLDFISDIDINKEVLYDYNSKSELSDKELKHLIEEINGLIDFNINRNSNIVKIEKYS